jgi:hypothetical protein
VLLSVPLRFQLIEQGDLIFLTESCWVRCNDVVATAIWCAIDYASPLARACRKKLRLLAKTSTDTNDLLQGRVDLELNAGVPTAAAKLLLPFQPQVRPYLLFETARAQLPYPNGCTDP